MQHVADGCASTNTCIQQKLQFCTAHWQWATCWFLSILASSPHYSKNLIMLAVNRVVDDAKLSKNNALKICCQCVSNSKEKHSAKVLHCSSGELPVSIVCVHYLSHMKQ